MIKNIKIIISLAILLTVILFLVGKFNIQSQVNPIKNENFLEQFKNAQHFLDITSKKDINDLKTFSIIDLPTASKFNNIFAVDKSVPIKTNQWFSSLYFSPGSENIFILPLAVRFIPNGLMLSIPNVGSNSDLIMAPAKQDILVDFKQEIEAKVLSSGDFSVLVGIYGKNDNTLLSTVMLTHGSPYIFIDTKNFSKINIKSFKKIKYTEGQSFRINDFNKISYGIFGSANLEMKIKDDKNLLIKPSKDYQINKKTFFTIGAMPKDFNWSEFKKRALNPVIDTDFYFLKTEKNKYVNVFDIQTLHKNSDTLWGLLPHQSANLLKNKKDTHCFEGHFYETIRGKQKICVGKTFYVKSGQNLIPPFFLNIKNINASYKETLKKIVKEDVRNLNGFKATDTYFLGKELLRAAQLYDLTKQLELKEESRKLKNILYSEFDIWRGNLNSKNTPEYGKYIVYDDKIKGIVGQKASFGSDEFNDHHFHYGYFVHVASILARYDKTFLKNNKKLVNLFIKDYLNINRKDRRFAFLRNFDVYEGHSWASGTAMFGDGNNQESSSEAIHSYYAGYLWGSIIQNEELKEVSLWLYNQEVDTALTYWLLASDYAPKYPKYKHSLLSLVWGGKSEFGTWFSGEPEAKVGIEVLPFTAGSEYLNQINQEVISKHLAETHFPEHKLFFDQLLMYQAIINPQKALRLFSDIKNKDIDGGNSKSFLYAWIVSKIK